MKQKKKQPSKLVSKLVS